MLEALTQGTRDPDVLADLARGALRRKLPALRQALAGRFRPHHRFSGQSSAGHLDYLDEVIAALSAHIEAVMAPLAEEPAGHNPRRE
jgi:transposase